MNADAPEGPNNRPVSITNNTFPDQMPDWSPNGEQIVFQRGPESGPPEIFEMNANGRGRVNLTNTAALAERDPSFSPDGSKIAFERETSGNREIWRMRAGGRNKVDLTDDPAVDTNPSWQCRRTARQSGTAS